MNELQLQNYKNRHSLASKLGRVLWKIVWLVFFRTTPRGNLFRPWRIFLLKLFGAKVEWSSNVLPICRIWQPWNLTMGAYACLSEDVDCYTVAPIVIGTQATVSQGVKICTASHDIASRIMELTTAPITVGGVSTKDVEARKKLNEEIIKGNRVNGYRCYWPMLLPKYAIKIWEVILPRIGLMG